MKRTSFAFILPLILSIAGLAVGGYGVWCVIQAKASASWPSVDGVVETSGIAAGTSAASDSRHATETTHRSDVVYRYKVGDVSYTGARVAFGGFVSKGPSAAGAVVEKYAPGRPVKVYYAVNNPREAVLEPGVRSQAWMPVIIGGILVFAALIVANFTARSNRGQAASTSPPVSNHH